MYKTIIIDDEKHCRKILHWAIGKQCPQLEIVAECQSGKEGIEAIQKHQPDLIFLDIEMRDMSGFQMLEKLGNVDFDIIFTTAYNQFAVDAFKVSAVDYLLKPIDENDLGTSVRKWEKRQEDPISARQIEFLLAQMKQNLGTQETSIAVPSSAGLEFIEIENIVYCQSDSNYTHLHFQNGKPMIVSKTLKDIEEMLPKTAFFRVHHSYTVHLKHIKRYLKADGGYLVMSNGHQVKVSRSKKDLLLEMF